MKFELKNINYGGYVLYEEATSELIELGDICLYKKEYTNQSYSIQNEDCFNYYGLKHIFSNHDDSFSVKRIVIIQMK